MVAVQNQNDIKIFSKLGIFMGFLLIAVIAVYFYSPVVMTHAESDANVDIRLKVNPAISLTTDTSELLLEGNPGGFVTGAINADVITNSQYGYTLTLEDADNDTSMHSTSEGVSTVISSNFSGSKTSDTMGNNTWGYSLDATNFNMIPVNGSYAVLSNTHVPTPNDPGYNRTTIRFGVKIGMTLTSGTYEDTVLFTAYVNGQNYSPLVGIHSISTMQQMTPAICNATTKPAFGARTSFDWDGSHHDSDSFVPITSLRDTRDNNYYLVAKLYDGNCWMVQNLALDLTVNEPVIVSNIDGTTTTATPGNTTQTTTGTIWKNDVDTWRSYKPQSSEAYFRNGITKSDSPSGDGVEYDWEKAGNYYNWYAATAGTGTSSMVGSEATASICPKGWRLPTSTGDKSYLNLFSKYSITSSSASRTRQAPIFLLLTGFYRNTDGKMISQSVIGDYWSASAYSSDSTLAYTEHLQTSAVYNAQASNKTQGYSVRCIAI